MLATVHVSWLDPRKVREITIVGDRRMATWDDLASLGPVMIFDKGVTRHDYADFGEFQLLAREGDLSIPRVAREEPLKAQARSFLECLDRGACTRSDGRVGAEVVRVLWAINRSIAARGAPVPVPTSTVTEHA